MAKRSISNASVQDLQAELRRRQRRLPALQKKRKKLEQQLAEIDQQIKELGGTVSKQGRSGTARKRPKNAMSLVDTLAKVMKKNQPMRVPTIADRAKKAGYKSNSANFTSIVNQALIKDKRFKQAERGKYMLA